MINKIIANYQTLQSSGCTGSSWQDNIKSKVNLHTPVYNFSIMLADWGQEPKNYGISKTLLWCLNNFLNYYCILRKIIIYVLHLYHVCKWNWSTIWFFKLLCPVFTLLEMHAAAWRIFILYLSVDNTGFSDSVWFAICTYKNHSACNYVCARKVLMRFNICV